MRVLTEEIRPGEPLEVDLEGEGYLTLACKVGETRLVSIATWVTPGRHTVRVPPGPCSHDGDLVPVVWTLRLDDGEPLRLRVLPGKTPAPTLRDRFAAIEPVVRGVWETVYLGAFVLFIVGIAGVWAVLDPAVPVGARIGIGVMLVAMLAFFTWRPVAALVGWARAATVPVPPVPRPLRPGGTWAPKTKLHWRLDRVESVYVRGTRTLSGDKIHRWHLLERRVPVAEGGPDDAVRLPADGPVDARAGRASVGWEWVAWRPDRPEVERRVRLEVR